MAIVTNVIKRAEIPHEPGEWMELKKLSYRQLEKAGEIASDKAMKQMKGLGGELIKSLREFGKEQQSDPNKKYDRDAVLKCGIVKWSYSEEVKDENIEALDEETALWAFNEILSFNNPRTEEQTKNA